MKRFAIVSVTLILVGVLFFGGSLFYYLSKNPKEEPKKPNSSQAEAKGEEETKADTSVPEDFEDNGIFSDYYDKAYEYMQSMTLEQKIGQLIFVESPAQGAGNLVLQYNVGGVSFISDNFDYLEKDNAVALVSGYQTSTKTPLFTAVTEEGGLECDISNHFRLSDEQFLSPRDLFAAGGLDSISDTETKKATLLKELGLNVNISPVCDISTSTNEYLYYRSLGQDAATTKEFVSNVTKVSQNSGVSVVLKHFPGYANNNNDGFAVTDSREYSELEQNELSVFKGGIDSGAHFVMLSNTTVDSIDSENSATFSSKVVYKLRNDLGFTGVVVSSKLSFNDTTKQNPAVKAIAAGSDMVYVADAQSAYNGILNAVNDNSLDAEKIDRACLRVLACKYAKGLIN